MKQSRRSYVFCALLFGALLLTTCAWALGGNVAEAANPDLTATLQSPGSLRNGKAVNLRFTLTNNSDADLYVLKWYTPLEGIRGKIFWVERDGQAVQYKGPLVMRGNPTREDYVLLKPGASVSAEVDLATAYDFSEAGEYTFVFLMPSISCVARTETEKAKTVDDLGRVTMPSNRVWVTILEDLEPGEADALGGVLSTYQQDSGC